MVSDEEITFNVGGSVRARNKEIPRMGSDEANIEKETLEQPTSLADLEKLAARMVAENRMPSLEVFGRIMEIARTRWHKHELQNDENPSGQDETTPS